jgi:hypothetical protein
MYGLCMSIRYLVSITQVRKDTSFGLDNWCDCEIIIIIIISLSKPSLNNTETA